MLLQKTLAFAPHQLSGTSPDKFKVFMNQAMLHVAINDFDSYPDGKHVALSFVVSAQCEELVLL